MAEQNQKVAPGRSDRSYIIDNERISYLGKIEDLRAQGSAAQLSTDVANCLNALFRPDRRILFLTAAQPVLPYWAKFTLFSIWSILHLDRSRSRVKIVSPYRSGLPLSYVLTRGNAPGA
jgi:hypothetical protein